MTDEAGREMDALMWLLLNDKPLDLMKCRYVDGDVQPHAGYPAGHISPDNFSTDIAAAWLVVEKLTEEYYVDIGIDKHGAQVQINYYTGSEYGWIHGESVRADTFPLAICRAALKAVNDG